ncbi:hypothetical protein EWM64_g687, partial [Hericium alpestre]
MVSLESVTKTLSELSIAPTASVSHAQAKPPAAWREALQSDPAAPKSFELVKTLVFKPKRHPRSLSPLAINEHTFPKVVTIVDVSIASSTSPLAVHALSSSATLFLSGQDLITYLRKLGTADTKLHEIDFVALKAEGGATPPAPAKPVEKKVEKEDAKIEGAVQVAIGVKEVEFSALGIPIIWEVIQEWFNAKIKEMEVENAYFPMFISAKALERETDHIEGFSPEVAWVTRAGQSDLEEPIAICPTSDTAMYFFQPMEQRRAMGVQESTYESLLFDTDIAIDMLSEPFLRTREYLWQEGHTAHLTKAEADKEVLEILDLYCRVYEELLAVPVIPGVKSENEKFTGGDYTTTVEGFIPTSGRGIRAATSHHLGQNSPSRRCSTSLSKTRTTRAVSARHSSGRTHGGLVLPPRVASAQAVVVPCGVTAKTTDAQRQQINDKCAELVKMLKKTGVRAKADLREGYTPGWKFNEWEQKGVPLRLEIGPQDLTKAQTLGVR